MKTCSSTSTKDIQMGKPDDEEKIEKKPALSDYKLQVEPLSSHSRNSHSQLTYTFVNSDNNRIPGNNNKSMSNANQCVLVTLGKLESDKKEMFKERLPMMVFEILNSWYNKEETNRKVVGMVLHDTRAKNV